MSAGRIDLSVLCPGMHLLGHDCLPVRSLRGLQVCGITMGPSRDAPRVEFVTHSITNRDKVTCMHCWLETRP